MLALLASASGDDYKFKALKGTAFKVHPLRSLLNDELLIRTKEGDVRRKLTMLEGDSAVEQVDQRDAHRLLCLIAGFANLCALISHRSHMPGSLVSWAL